MSQAVHGGLVALPTDALVALRQAKVSGHKLRLPEALPRAVYTALADALEKVGGHWDRLQQAIVFDGSASNAIAPLLAQKPAPARNPHAFFPTPIELARAILGNRTMHGRILEPSAGTGTLAQAIQEKVTSSQSGARLEVCELDEARAQTLLESGYQLIGRDFFALTGSFDHIVMNPPFSSQGNRHVWLEHVLHGLDLLGSTGSLTAILPESAIHRHPKNERWAKVLRRFGEFQENDPKAFIKSGASIRTVTVYIDLVDDAWKALPYQGHRSWYAWQLGMLVTTDSQVYNRLYAMRGSRVDFLKTAIQTIKEVLNLALKPCEGMTRLSDLQQHLTDFPTWFECSQLDKIEVLDWLCELHGV
jgi:predicted RNA methylase